MANSKTLLQLDGENINQYIISNNPDIIDEDSIRDGGSIVIVSNDDGTNLYVGDEHIAGGYGFKDENEKETILNLVNELKRVEEKVDYLHGITNDEETNVIQNHKPASIDEEKNTITIGNQQFKLKIDETDQQFYVESYYRPEIYNVVFKYSDIEKNYIYEEDIYDAIDMYSYSPTQVTFDYNGSYNIKSCDIIYDYEYPTNNTTNYTLKSNSNVTITDKVPDPNLDENVIQKHIIIDFTLSDTQKLRNDAGNNESIINLKIKVTLENNISLLYTFAKWYFVYPCIYAANVDEIKTKLSDNTNFFIITENHKSNIVTFKHGTNLSEGILYVPQTMFGKAVLSENIVCISNTSNIRFRWITNKLTKIFNKKNGGSIQYWTLSTPQKYKENVDWYFSLDQKF